MDYVKQLVGLAFLAWPLTLLVLVGLAFFIVIPLVVRFAKRTGRSKWRWGIAGFLVVFLPIFWDWIPTVVMHKYYCSTEAGFWVYKTVDEWKDENPGISGTLTPKKLLLRATSYGSLLEMNDRFVVEIHRKKPVSILPTTVTEKLLIDTKKLEVLAKDVSVGSYVNPRTDGLRGFKFWLGSKPCHTNDFGQLMSEIRDMEVAK